MAPNTVKVVYKPDSQSSEEYVAIVNPEPYKKWKDGDTTIPLVDVVDSFTVFHSNQGAQGILRQPSKQQLETTFGTAKDVDVVTHILKHGKEAGEGSFGSNGARGGVADGRHGVKQNTGHRS